MKYYYYTLVFKHIDVKQNIWNSEMVQLDFHD